MGKITKISTSSPEEWRELRSHYIGGSDAAAVVCLNAFSSPYSLWAEKTGRTPGFSGNLATEVGTYLEEFVAKKFEEETGKKVRNCNQSFLNSDYPFAIGNVDRLVVGEKAGLEIKTTDSINLNRFAGREYPENYYVQMVHYLAMTGLERWYLAVLIGNREFKIYTVERDEEEISALMEAERQFWAHVENDTPPSVDGLKVTGDTISKIYPTSNDDVIDLMGYEKDLRLYGELGRRIKELKTDQDEVANRIKEAIGENAGGICEGYKVSWKASSRSTFDAKRFAKDHPEMDLTDYFKTTSARTFRVTELKDKGE